jgi:hypothetical protein
MPVPSDSEKAEVRGMHQRQQRTLESLEKPIEMLPISTCERQAIAHGQNSEGDGLSQPQFLEQVRREIRKGLTLVPFLGSGVSAPSGILMGVEFGCVATF